MDSKDYFEAHKDKIKLTAEFLCSKDSTKNVDDVFEELKQHYISKIGTEDKEIIMVNNQEVDISKAWLELLRHEEYENFIMIAMTEKGTSIIYKSIGDQFSSKLDLNQIDSSLINLVTYKGVKNIGIYVVHNHPYIYKASPSSADFQSLVLIENEFKAVEQEVRNIGKNCEIYLVDFAIVTEFDYWSYDQSMCTSQEKVDTL